MVGGALILSVILKTFFVQAFYIPSESMVPTLLTNDKVLVQKVSYWRGEGEPLLMSGPATTVFEGQIAL